MAQHRALQPVGTTLIRLLKEHCPPALAEHSRFELLRSGAHEAALHQGLTLMLYRVTVNSALRRPPVPAPGGVLQRPPLVVDLHFLLSAWAAGADLQMQLLGWALRCMEDHAVLPASLLNGVDPIDPVFASQETVELAFEPLTLDEHLRVWNPQTTRLPVSLSYVVRGVALDAEAPPAALRPGRDAAP